MNVTELPPLPLPNGNDANNAVPFLVHQYVTEGVQDLPQELHSHVTIFYEELITLMEGASESRRLITKEIYTTILTVMIRIRVGEPVKLLRPIYPQIYKWYQKYALVASGENLLSWHPHDAYGYAGVDENVDMETVKRLSYFKVAYSDIKRAHGEKHTRGASCMLVLVQSLRTLDTNRPSHSPTRAQCFVITGLLIIELVGLQETYLGGATMKVITEREVARNESLGLWLAVRVMEMSLAIVRFAGAYFARAMMRVISEWKATRNESLDYSSG
jgi:hypothetical protein